MGLDADLPLLMIEGSVGLLGWLVIMSGTGRLANIGVLVLLILNWRFGKVFDSGLEEGIFGSGNTIDFAFWCLTLLGFDCLECVSDEHVI